MLRSLFRFSVVVGVLTIGLGHQAHTSSGALLQKQSLKPIVNIHSLVGKVRSEWEKVLGKSVSNFEDRESEPGIVWYTYKVKGLSEPQLRVEKKSGRVLSFGATISNRAIKTWQSALAAFGIPYKGARAQSDIVKSANGSEGSFFIDGFKDRAFTCTYSPGDNFFLLEVASGGQSSEMPRREEAGEGERGTGSNMLTRPPVFQALAGSSATHKIDGRTHTIQISQPGTEKWGVQIYWELPPTNAGDKVRVQFEVEGTRGLEVTARLQQLNSPFAPVGLDKTVPVSTDWSRHQFEFTAEESSDNTALIFWCSPGPGTVSIRSVTLQKTSTATASTSASASLITAFGKSKNAYERILGAGKHDESVTDQRDYYYTWKGKQVCLTLFNAGDFVDTVTIHQAGATWQDAIRLLGLDPATLKAGKPVNGDTPIEGFPGGAKGLFVPVGTDGGSLMISMPKQSQSAAAAPALTGVFLGSLYVNGQASGGNSPASTAAKSVRLTLDKTGTYKFEQVSSGLTRIEGGALLIASGKATWMGSDCILTPDNLGPSSLSVCGWSFGTTLTLKREADGSLSILGRPNGMTDPLPRGQELRFRP